MSEIGECKNDRVTRDQAAGLTVRDAMNTVPKALPADGTVAELRELFDNHHVMTALVLDGSDFVGVVHRDEVPGADADEMPLREVATSDVTTVAPDLPLTEALRIMDAEDARRLPVIDRGGRRLAGLLCLTRDRQGFCQS